MKKIIIETTNQSQVLQVLAFAKTLQMRTTMVDDIEDEYLMSLMKGDHEGYATEIEKKNFLKSLGK